MAGYDDRLEALRALVDQATEALENVPGDMWDQYSEGFARMQVVLPYAATVLAFSEAALVPPEPLAELEGALSAVRDSVLDSPQSVEPWATQILRALAGMPVARGQDTAQEAKDAASTLHKSMAGRIGTLKGELTTLTERAERLEEALATRSGEIDTAMAERRAEADKVLTEMQTAAEASQQRIRDIEAEQAQAFEDAQEERSNKLEQEAASLKARFETRIEEIEENADGHLATLRRREEETKTLVQAIGEYGTGGRYAKEVKEQRKQANLWRWITVAVAAAAVGIAVWAAATAKGNIDDARLVSKALISIILAGLAGYTAKQSARHRAREEHAKSMELDMAVFPVLIDGMEPNKQQEQREKVLDKTIARPLAATDKNPDGGPSLVDQLQELIRRSGDGTGGA